MFKQFVSNSIFTLAGCSRRRRLTGKALDGVILRHIPETRKLKELRFFSLCMCYILSVVKGTDTNIVLV